MKLGLGNDIEIEENFYNKRCTICKKDYIGRDNAWYGICPECSEKYKNIGKEMNNKECIEYLKELLDLGDNFMIVDIYGDAISDIDRDRFDCALNKAIKLLEKEDNNGKN